MKKSKAFIICAAALIGLSHPVPADADIVCDFTTELLSYYRIYYLVGESDGEHVQYFADNVICYGLQAQFSQMCSVQNLIIGSQFAEVSNWFDAGLDFLEIMNNLGLACSNPPDVSSCMACENADTIGWTVADTVGYERRIVTCGSGCPSFSDYRCAAGYYGRSTNGLSGCESCKTATGNDNATSASGSIVIGNCYMPAGATNEDDTGTIEYIGNCYYSVNN
ncbi:MAG: hypothetical protein LBJ73_03815 [Rickettsiales bacterium]|jgi:hypothetical protein|nr:hypothetical protein [Rickettsiales bacterium]